VSSSPVYSTILGNSSKAMCDIARMYIPDGALVADLTINRGVFWRKLPQVNVVGSDLARFPQARVICDLTETPYRSETFDVVVLDPPYANSSTTKRSDGPSDAYYLVAGLNPKTLRKLYYHGMFEANRILKKGGILIVKCQSGVNAGKQEWLDVDVHFIGTRLVWMVAQDRFNMVPPANPTIRHPDRPQQHARKWGSTFWIFKKRRR
jgi:hypothetical protein